jgi:hypothetical protein
MAWNRKYSSLPVTQMNLKSSFLVNTSCFHCWLNIVVDTFRAQSSRVKKNIVRKFVCSTRDGVSKCESSGSYCGENENKSSGRCCVVWQKLTNVSGLKS